jgi:hypothetical protein
LLKPGTLLAITESYRVMKVETFEDTTDAEGRQILSLKGRSLEAILDNRVAISALTDLTTDPKWVLAGTATNIARQIFHDICIVGTISPTDVIPYVIEGSIFPVDTIAEPTEIIGLEYDPQSVYSVLSSTANLYDFGFRLVRNFDLSQLYFDVYMGSDRTTQQSILPAVVFAPNLDNLRNTTELTTSANYKNVAYVISPVGHAIVVPDLIDPDIEGFDRHVLLVKADDITDTDPPTATALMIQRGNEELARNRQFSAFDGEISQDSGYQYGRDYNLGDLVELRNVDGATSNMQVTEQIFVSDRDGERSYPTLSINSFIMPGTWLSWNYHQKWEDLGATDYWSTV